MAGPRALDRRLTPWTTSHATHGAKQASSTIGFQPTEKREGARASSEFAAAAWDETFAREVDDLYRVQVAPALRDVNEALDELGARPTLLRLAADAKAQAAATATIGLAAAGGLTHLDLPALVYGSGPAVGAAAAAATEGLRRRKVRGEAGRNAFYFLYESNRRLS